MSNTRTKQDPCAGCIYEDCYIGICKACEEARKAELRKLSDLVKVYQQLSFEIFTTFARRKEVFVMSTEEKQIKVEQASKLAKWFKISIEISIFGHVIFSKTWPPQD